MSDSSGGHPSSHSPQQSPNKRPSPAEQGPYSATYPVYADLPTDEVCYGPDIPTEAEFRLLGDLDGRRVLVLGAGRGQTAVTMAAQGGHVVVVDPNADSLAEARALAEELELRIEVHETDLADLAFLRADSVDVVFSAYSLATVPDLDRGFRQANRVLKSGGPLVFSLPHPAFAMVDPASSDPLRIRRSYWDTTPRPFEVDAHQGADHPHTIADLFGGLQRANFHVDTILEPAPDDEGPRSEYHSEIMRWVPATLVMRARKQGI